MEALGRKSKYREGRYVLKKASICVDDMMYVLKNVLLLKTFELSMPLPHSMRYVNSGFVKSFLWELRIQVLE
jgi:hypothetical protein